MPELLGPGMAKTILGPRYKEDKTYFLLEKEDTFAIQVLDPKTGESETYKLEPTEVNQEKLDVSASFKDEKRKVGLSAILLWVAVGLSILATGWVILWRLNMLDTVLRWFVGVTG